MTPCFLFQNPLRDMISHVDEELSRLANKKLSLEEAVEQVSKNISISIVKIGDYSS